MQKVIKTCWSCDGKGYDIVTDGHHGHYGHSDPCSNCGGTGKVEIDYVYDIEYNPSMKNTLLTITGPSCSGKSTLQSKLTEKYNLGKIVSFTTRPPRPGERQSIDYHFLGREDAEKAISNGEMAEHVEFSGNLYGITGSELETKLQKSSCVVIVEPRGLVQLTEYTTENNIRHRAIFLTNPPEVLSARFLARFREDVKASPIDYAKRMVNMLREEQNWIHLYGYHAIYIRFDSANETDIIGTIYPDLLWEE